jgi:hypothetical protein
VIMTIVWNEPLHILGFLIILELRLGLDILRYVVGLVLSLGLELVWTVLS